MCEESVDTGAITDRIFNDAEDPARGFTECTDPADEERGAVVFEPWADQAWTPTPSPTPSPTATPTATPPATATATPSPVAGTRDFDLQQGWNNFVWTGPSGTDPATVLDCIEGNYAMAYRFVNLSQTFDRYVPDNELLSNMTDVDKYDSLLVLVTTSGVQCLGMPVDP